jgi:parallel beta-helix repeat protein
LIVISLFGLETHSFSQCQIQKDDILTLKSQNTDFIKIDGNEDFHEHATLNQWNGSGIKIAPYLIENLTLRNSVEIAIYIRNTNLHFIIRGCVIKNTSTGIDLYHVNNSVIENNTITDQEYQGIVISGYNNTVKNNKISNSKDGIWLSGGNNTIKKNILSNNEKGGITSTLPFFDHIYDNVFLNNTIFATSSRFPYDRAGKSQETQYSFQNNTINNLPIKYLYQQNHLTIEEKKFSQIIIYLCTDVELVNQTITNTYSEISIIKSTNITIANNSLSLGGNGLVISECEKVLVENNLFTKGHTGLTLHVCTNTSVHYNSFSEYGTGIALMATSLYGVNINISHNQIMNNIYGIYVRSSGNPRITNNNVTRNDYGITLRSSDNITVLQNSVTGNKYVGIQLVWWGRDITITQNVISYTGIGYVYEGYYFEDYVYYGTGIHLYNAYNCSVSLNEISYNRNYGISLHGTKHTQVVQNNFIDNNLEGTSQAYSRWYYWDKYDDNSCCLDNFSHNYWSDWSAKMGGYKIDCPLAEHNFTDMNPQPHPYQVNWETKQKQVHFGGNILVTLVISLAAIVILKLIARRKTLVKRKHQLQ